MTRESREARQERAIVALLRALPEDSLGRVLVEVGVTSDRIAKAVDHRRCAICNHPYQMCRAKDPIGDHEFVPVEPRPRP